MSKIQFVPIFKNTFVHLQIFCAHSSQFLFQIFQEWLLSQEQVFVTLRCSLWYGKKNPNLKYLHSLHSSIHVIQKFFMSLSLCPSYTNSHPSGALSSLSSPSLVCSYRKQEGKAGGQNHILCLFPVHSGLDLVTLCYVTFYYHLWLRTSLFYFLKPNYTYSF